MKQKVTYDASLITDYALLWRRYAGCEGKEFEKRRGGRDRTVRRSVRRAAQQGAHLFGSEMLYGESALWDIGDEDSWRREGLGQEALETEGHRPRSNSQLA